MCNACLAISTIELHFIIYIEYEYLFSPFKSVTNVSLSLPDSRLLWRGKSGDFGISPSYFSRLIIFLAIINPADSAFWVSGGMSHDTLHVAFNMSNKHI